MDCKTTFSSKKLSDVCPSISIFVDHIEYITKMIGDDYVGIGSDYDGLIAFLNIGMIAWTI